MATFVFTIGGVDYRDFVEIRSINIQDGLPAQGDTMRFTIVLSSTSMDATPGVPQAGQIVVFSVDGRKQFSGVILNADQQVHQSRQNYIFGCTASDFTYLLDSRLVKGKIPAGLCGNIVQMLVGQYAPGFGTRFVQAGFAVPENEFDHVPLANVIDQYAQSVGFSWYIDFDLNLHFNAGEAAVGPVSTIDLDDDDRFGDVNINEDTAQLRNRIYVKDATVRSAEKRTDTFVADEGQSFFKLFSPPFDEHDAEVFRNGTKMDLQLDTLTTQEGEVTGAHNMCFFCIVNSGLRFPLSDLPHEGDIIEASYFPEEGGGDNNIVIVVEDPDSIRMMRQRESMSNVYVSSGVHEHILSMPQIRALTLDPLGYIGGLALDRLAWPEVSGSFTVSDPAVVGWRPGQSVTLLSVYRNVCDARRLWRNGIRDNRIKVFIQTVEKSYIPYGAGLLRIETVQFSNLADRSSI